MRKQLCCYVILHFIFLRKLRINSVYHIRPYQVIPLHVGSPGTSRFTMATWRFGPAGVDAFLLLAVNPLGGVIYLSNWFAARILSCWDKLTAINSEWMKKNMASIHGTYCIHLFSPLRAATYRTVIKLTLAVNAYMYWVGKLKHLKCAQYTKNGCVLAFVNRSAIQTVCDTFAVFILFDCTVSKTGLTWDYCDSLKLICKCVKVFLKLTEATGNFSNRSK